MAATGTPTPNIGLRIPQGTDPASVDDINYNSNLLDTKLGAVGNTSVQAQIDSLNSNIATKYSAIIFNTAIMQNNGSTDLSYVSRSGNTVTVFINARTVTDIAGWGSLGITIPEGFRPNRVIFPIVQIGEVLGTLNVRVTGDVISGYGTAIAANTLFRTVFTYNI